jgi:nicotinamidase-related amidase
MSRFTDRPNTALMVLDVQNGVVANAHDRDSVIANIRSLVERARAGQVPVVWVQHSDEDLARDSDEWQYVPELVREDGEPLVHKHTATRSTTPTWSRCWPSGAWAGCW